MQIIRLIGQFTPFISPSLDRFEKKAVQSSFLSRLPYLSFFENWAKYPVLLFGRLVLALLLTSWLTSLTLQPAYQNLVQQQLDRYLPSLSFEIDQSTKTGNLWQDFWKNAGSTVQHSQQVLERQFWRNIVHLILVSEAFVIFRGIVIFFLYSLLFLVFGNDIGSVEKRALRFQASLGQLARSFLYKIQSQADYLFQNQLLSPQDHQKLKTLIAKGLDKRQSLSAQEIDDLSNFAFGQLRSPYAQVNPSHLGV